MLLADLVSTSALVAGTRARTEKREHLADLLRRVPVEEIEIAAAYLSGTLLQRRTGVGWRGLAELPPPAPTASLSLREVDAALEAIAALAGAGSGTARRTAVAELFGALTAEEQDFLRAVMTGQVRQGALDSVMLDAVAAAAEVPLKAVRRAAMFSGPTGPVAQAALTGGVEALEAFDLEVGRPVRPMLASSAPDVAAGFAPLAETGPVVVDTKLDGIRIQVHKQGDDVRIFTRSLDEITERLPDVVELVRGLPSDGLILDGEAMTLDAEGRPRPFQETASRTASVTAVSDPSGGAAVHPFFFDLLAHEGTSYVERPGSERWEVLDRAVPETLRTRRLVTVDVEEAADRFAEVIGAGHEGVILKRPDAPYEAGRRGAGWVKVKPRHTLDLVVLGVEHGSGRRRGFLSNIHLGARDPESGGFVMLGKTFKGLSDTTLAWQTERFRELQIEDDGWVVTVRPEQVVEIAFDGVQRSTRYPGGVTLRFARVLRYRDDKAPGEADTLDAVRAFLG